MMKKNIIVIIGIIILLLVSGCTSDSTQTTENEKYENEISDFCLISESATIELNADISKINMEPLSVEYGSGDGFKWTENKYEDIEIKALISDDGISMMNRISTETPIYKTTRGIRVGDDITKLKKLYNEYLTYSESVERTYYVYDPEDDIGFRRIYFYVENNIINKIIIEDGIDG